MDEDVVRLHVDIRNTEVLLFVIAYTCSYRAKSRGEQRHYTR
jgi:hypothetical protein